MSLYPKQLQFYPDDSIATGPGGSQIRDAAPGSRVVYSNGFVPPADINVNDVIFAIGSLVYGIDLTGITYSKRTRPEHRPLQDSFGQTVVFAAAGALPEWTVNGLIANLRTLYDLDRVRGPESTGYATSVLN